MKFLAHLTETGIKFDSDYNRARFKDFCKEHTGKQIRIELTKGNVSDNKRAWMFGAIIPFLKKLVPDWENRPEEEVYSIVKTEFGGFTAIGTDGLVHKYAGTLSSREADTERFDNAILLLSEWVRNNYGLELPNPEEYKREADIPVLKE